MFVWRCGVLVAAFINCIIFPFQLAFEDRHALQREPRICIDVARLAVIFARRMSFDSAPTWTAVYLGLDILLWLDILLPKVSLKIRFSCSPCKCMPRRFD